ncbi:MAG: FAD-binding protein [Chloroflexota bacterium]|nr:FAD-binding protein [Chloroflexota bacterium]
MIEVISPADAGKCARALADAVGARRTVRIEGAGTKAYIGDGTPTDAVLATRLLAGIVDHVPADLTVTVRGGTALAFLQRTLGGAGQFLPLDPPHPERATIGGVVAANSNGFGRVRYGGVRDALIGTTVALADGTLARAGGRVVKNVAGYDLNKLFTGSLGTLGVIVEATLKVLPLPAATAIAEVRVASAADAFAITDALLRTPLRPTALVVDADRGAWRLLVAAAGERVIVERAMLEVARRAEDVAGVVERSDGPEALLAPLRDMASWATDGALVRAALPLAATGAYAESAIRNEAVSRVVADAGSGIVRAHAQGDDAGVIAAADSLVAAARVVGGSAHVERRAPALRDRLRAWPGPPPGAAIMRRLKEAFDPAGILEPGRSAIG